MKQEKKNRVNFRCTLLEKLAIDNMAKKCGRTTSDYCRLVILGYLPKQRLTEEELQLLREIRKVASDLQHIKNYFVERKYTQTMQEVTNVINQLKSILYDCNR